MNKKPPELMKAEIEGVSILKPLKGVDPNLEDNLETLFELDYPQVFCTLCTNKFLAMYANFPTKHVNLA